MSETDEQCSIEEHYELAEKLHEVENELELMLQSHERLLDLIQRAMPYCKDKAPRDGYDYRMLLNQIDRALFDASMDSLQ